MVLFRERRRWYATILVTGILCLAYAGTSLAETEQLGQEEIQREIAGIKLEVTQLKEQMAKLQEQIMNLQAEIESLKGKPAVEAPPLKTGEVAINKSFFLWNAWKVQIVSYRILEDRRVRFNFLIKNMQDEPADFYFHRRRAGGLGPYLLDNQANKYYNPIIFPEDARTLIQDMPLEAHMIFPELKEGAEKVVVYFRFYGYSKRDRELRSENLYYGPIELR